MTQLIHEQLSFTVRGVMMNVYNQLGPMLPEYLYQDAITLGLQARGITCLKEKSFEIVYRNVIAGEYNVDLWIENGSILVELKVAPQILPIHLAQTLSYLKLSNADLAIVANFGAKLFIDRRLPNFMQDKPVDFQWQPRKRTPNLLYPELTNRLFEALHRVHFTLGSGFIHRVYRQALKVELQHQSLNFEYIRRMKVSFNNQVLGSQRTQVFKVEDKVLLGVFATKTFNEAMQINMMARLRRLGLKLGLLANFYGEKLKVETVGA